MIITHLRLGHHVMNTARDTRWLHKAVAALVNDRHLWATPRPGVVIVQSMRPLPPVEWCTTLGSSLVNPLPSGAEIDLALIGNPTVAISRNGARSRRQPLPPNAWHAWLERKLAGAVTITSLSAELLPPVRAHKTTGIVTLTRVAFTASGVVGDERLLQHLREAGVGRGKAYGCGLLLGVER